MHPAYSRWLAHTNLQVQEQPGQDRQQASLQVLERPCHPGTIGRIELRPGMHPAHSSRLAHAHLQVQTQPGQDHQQASLQMQQRPRLHRSLRRIFGRIELPTHLLSPLGLRKQRAPQLLLPHELHARAYAPTDQLAPVAGSHLPRMGLVSPKGGQWPHQHQVLASEPTMQHPS